MARACGIHIDQRRFRLIALDGSPKRHKVVAHLSGEIPLGDDPVTAVASRLKKVSKKKISPDSVELAVDSGLASFRHLKLPFDDRTKIEEVLKFEIENELPQWDIDQVIVDFIVAESKPGVESQLLVTALPKERLALQLQACELAGLEANDAELDGTALFNATHAAGIFDEESAQLIVHVGDSTTAVVVVDGGRMIDMRAIRAGGRPQAYLGDDVALEEDDEVSEEREEGEEDGASEASAFDRDDPETSERLAQSAQRIRRELGRTLSAARTTHPIEAIYVVGGNDMPELFEGEIFDVPVHPLEVVPEIEGVEDPQEFAVAYGAALRGLGGTQVTTHLRRENLRFSGTFERLELPLAVFSLLLFTLLAVQVITTNRQLQWRDIGDPDHSKGIRGDMQVWMDASNGYMLPSPEGDWAGRLKTPSETLSNYIADATAGKKDQFQTKFQQISWINTQLLREIKEIEKELNLGAATADDAQPQSALMGSALVLGTMDSMGPDLGRFALRRVQADFNPGSGTRADSVEVKLDVDFFGESSVEATRHFNNLKNELGAQVWFVDFENRSLNPFDEGVYVENMRVIVDVAKALEAEIKMGGAQE